MLHTKHYQNNFHNALRTARISRGLNQEAFSLVSSRTYVSSLERGLKVPTLNKVEELAEVLDIHPLTLLVMSYMTAPDLKTASALFEKVMTELLKIMNSEMPAPRSSTST